MSTAHSSIGIESANVRTQIKTLCGGVQGRYSAGRLLRRNKKGLESCLPSTCQAVCHATRRTACTGGGIRGPAGG